MCTTKEWQIKNSGQIGKHHGKKYNRINSRSIIVSKKVNQTEKNGKERKSECWSANTTNYKKFQKKTLCKGQQKRAEETTDTKKEQEGEKSDSVEDFKIQNTYKVESFEEKPTGRNIKKYGEKEMFFCRCMRTTTKHR